VTISDKARIIIKSLNDAKHQGKSHDMTELIQVDTLLPILYLILIEKMRGTV